MVVDPRITASDRQKSRILHILKGVDCEYMKRAEAENELLINER